MRDDGYNRSVPHLLNLFEIDSVLGFVRNALDWIILKAHAPLKSKYRVYYIPIKHGIEPFYIRQLNNCL